MADITSSETTAPPPSEPKPAAPARNESVGESIAALKTSALDVVHAVEAKLTSGADASAEKARLGDVVPLMIRR
jgi:hypothetical protein